MIIKGLPMAFQNSGRRSTLDFSSLNVYFCLFLRDTVWFVLFQMHFGCVLPSHCFMEHRQTCVIFPWFRPPTTVSAQLQLHSAVGMKEACHWKERRAFCLTSFCALSSMPFFKRQEAICPGTKSTTPTHTLSQFALLLVFLLSLPLLLGYFLFPMALFVLQ